MSGAKQILSPNGTLFCPSGLRMMRGLLVIGGAGPSADVLRDEARRMDLIVAADSGLDLAISAGLTPGIVVGDMDSLSDVSLLDRFPPDAVLRFPADKDETDTEIGLRVMRERGCTEVTLAGGGGGRIDHLLGIAALFEREMPPAAWLTDREEIFLVEGEREFAGWEGSTVSVFPVGASASRMTSTGLQWSLEGLEFRRGFAGISNRVTGPRVVIKVGIGKLLVVRSRSDDTRHAGLDDAAYRAGGP
jgi:thiamine pyrophosphokinase